jgi:TPR repeat protein/tRNA A-37 threonylcarbamoyl transferase component Bud32
MQAPERLGKYLIRRELGRGAMGVVYEGYDPLIERAVAIKVLRLEENSAELAAELRTRFRREAQAAGRLGHPGIVAVYEYGEDAAADSAFIAMELVRGRDLKSLFDAGTRFSLRETGRLMEELLSALQHAHERGVVHRDIKPGNIILLDGGGLKVADFGIAKLDTSELTQLGSVLGTVSHMAPEQLTGEPVDRRSDLYSCGVILYQLLTGERPFVGSPASLMHKVLHEAPVPPSQRTPGLPPAFDAVVLRAMAKSADQRHADAPAFAAELRAAFAAPKAVVPPAAAVGDDATVVRPRAPTPIVGPTVARGSTQDVTWPIARESTQPPARAPVVDPTGAPPFAPSATSATLAPSAPAPHGMRGVGIAVLGVAGIVAAAAGAWQLLAPRAPAPATPAIAGASQAEGAARVAAATVPASATPATAAPSPPPSSAETPAAPTPPASSAATTPTLPSIAPLAPIEPPPLAPAPAALTPRAPAAPAATPPAPAPMPPAAPAPAPASTRTSVATAAPTPTTPIPSPARPPAAPPSSSVQAPPPAPRVALAPAPPAPSTASTPPHGATPRGDGRVAPADATRTAPTSSDATRTTPAASGASPPRTDECLEDARRGSARCQVVMGNAYRAGRGVIRDPAEAARWYRKAAEQGSDVGQYELGVMLENGLGVARDPNAAVSWYRKSADQGYARAQYALGRAYENGLATPTNYVLAAEWYGKAADQNLAGAQYSLARLYLQGRGVFRDTAKAQALLQKSADAGDPNAMVYLAEMYAKGDGKPRDREQATRLFRDALARPGLNDRNRAIAERALASAR